MIRSIRVLAVLPRKEAKEKEKWQVLRTVCLSVVNVSVLRLSRNLSSLKWRLAPSAGRRFVRIARALSAAHIRVVK